MLTKTIKLLLISLSLGMCSLHAQFTATSLAATPAVLPFTNDVDSVFQNLNKSYVTTILYDRVFPYAALHMFNTSSADTSFKGHFLQGYYELYNAAYNSAAFTLPDSIDQRLARIVKAGRVPIGIYNYQFNQVDTNAVADNLISVMRNISIDNNPLRIKAHVHNITIDRLRYLYQIIFLWS